MNMNQAEQNRLYIDDTGFESLLSESVQGHSFVHWTPIEVIKVAVDWLGTNKDNRILDIGSGVGKFCANP